MKAQDYEVRVRPLSEAEGGLFAEMPGLLSCMSDGETPQEALENAYDAILCWREACKEMGRAIPEPKRAAA